MSWKCPHCGKQNDQAKMVCKCGNRYPDAAAGKQDAGSEGKKTREESNSGVVVSAPKHEHEPSRATVSAGTFTTKEENKPGSLFLVIPAVPLLVLGSWLIYSNFMDAASFLFDTGGTLVIVSVALFIKMFSGRSIGERVRKYHSRPGSHDVP